MPRQARVILLKQIKRDGRWIPAPALFDSKGRVRRDHVRVQSNQFAREARTFSYGAYSAAEKWLAVHASPSRYRRIRRRNTRQWPICSLTAPAISVIVGNNLRSLFVGREDEIRRLGGSSNQIVRTQIEALGHSEDSSKAWALNPAF